MIFDESDLLELRRVCEERFSIISELGRGGMGVVFKVQDLTLNRLVAIKVLPPLLAQRPDLKERFLREARTAARLNHPNIVPIHAVEEHGNLLFFVMAFIEGETLEDRVVRTGPLPLGEAMRIFHEVSWALAEAHREGVVHRDIKPANVILERSSGRAMVTDFGIAIQKGVDRVTGTGQVVGTLRFMSPEQAGGLSVDGRSDIYSLGLTTFFALTGRTPHEARTLLQAALPELSAEDTMLSALRPEAPRSLVRIVEACLPAAPSDRVQSAAELAEQVGEIRTLVPESDTRVQRYVEDLRTLARDVGGYGLLAGAVTLSEFLDATIDSLFPVEGTDRFFDRFGDVFDWVFNAGLVTAALALVIIGLARWYSRTRVFLGNGYSFRDLQAALLSQVSGEPRRSPSPQAIGGAVLWLAGLTFGCGFWYLVIRLGWLDSLPPWLSVPSWGLAAAVPVLIGRGLAGRTMRGWLRLWSGRFGRRALRLVGFGRRTDGAGFLRSADPTEIAVAEAAVDVFKSLPEAHRDRLHEVPDLINRLERDAQNLRRREAEIAQALADAGISGVAGRVLLNGVLDQNTERPDRRLVAVAALRQARDETNRRLASAVGALETLRLTLLRLRAGVGTVDDLSEDIARAEAIEAEIEAEIAGRQEVERFLAE